MLNAKAGTPNLSVKDLRDCNEKVVEFIITMFEDVPLPSMCSLRRGLGFLEAERERERERASLPSCSSVSSSVLVVSLVLPLFPHHFLSLFGFLWPRLLRRY